jgi:uncharacterized integral membrane protein
MSEHHAPQNEPDAPSEKPSGSALSLSRPRELIARLGTGRRPALIALAVYAVLLFALNTHSVSISLVFFSIHTGLLVLIAVSVLVGFLGGYLVRGRRDGDKKSS